jgi:hypothetical protein
VTLRLLTITVLLVAFAIPATADAARSPIKVGIGDRDPRMFQQKAFKRLKIKRVRFFIRWDAARKPKYLRWADAYVRNARKARISVLMHIMTDDLRIDRGTLPTAHQYRRDVGALVRRYRPMGVREWGVWNEANHHSEPTYRYPARAAYYFRIMRRLCRGCTIVALDVLDQRSAPRYIARFYRALGRKNRRRAAIVGIHNYADVNRLRTRGTRAVMRAVRRYNKRAQFWLTETGGFVHFKPVFPCNERRAANRLRYLFRLVRALRRDIRRVYYHQWSGENCRKFDAGLVRRNGKPRPAYHVLRDVLRGFSR